MWHPGPRGWCAWAEEVKCFTPLPRPGEWAGDREATGLTVQYLFYSTAQNNTEQDRTVLGRKKKNAYRQGPRPGEWAGGAGHRPTNKTAHNSTR